MIKKRRLIAFAICLVMLFNLSVNTAYCVKADNVASTDGAAVSADVSLDEVSPAQSVTESVTTSEVATTETVHDTDYYDGEEVVRFEVDSYLEDKVNIRWSVNVRKATGYIIYRKDNVSDTYEVIAKGKPDGNYFSTVYPDEYLVKGVTYTYLVQPYYVMSDESVRYGTLSSELTYKREFAAPTLKSTTRTKKKVKVKWAMMSGVNGYEIFRAKGNGAFSKVKRVNDSTVTSATIGGNALKKTYRYKIRAFVMYLGEYVYSDFSEILMVDTNKNSTVIAKFKKLKKKYPEGYYWNHMGKSNFSHTTITTIPCNHARFGYTYCNRYDCPTGYTGLQCYGFAWLMSDLIYGKNKKYTKHKKFAKAKVGDVIRYNGHSVIITAKYSNYIIVGECNYGGTCIIKWGRRIYKSELTKATYFHRNL